MNIAKRETLYDLLVEHNGCVQGSEETEIDNENQTLEAIDLVTKTIFHKAYIELFVDNLAHYNVLYETDSGLIYQIQLLLRDATESEISQDEKDTNSRKYTGELPLGSRRIKGFRRIYSITNSKLDNHLAKRMIEGLETDTPDDYEFHSEYFAISTANLMVTFSLIADPSSLVTDPIDLNSPYCAQLIDENGFEYIPLEHLQKGERTLQ